jgi:hypothetical protein
MFATRASNVFQPSSRVAPIASSSGTARRGRKYSWSSEPHDRSASALEDGVSRLACSPVLALSSPTRRSAFLNGMAAGARASKTGLGASAAATGSGMLGGPALRWHSKRIRQSGRRLKREDPPEPDILAGPGECRGDWIPTSDLLNPDLGCKAPCPLSNHKEFSWAARACFHTSAGTSAGFMRLNGYGKRTGAGGASGCAGCDGRGSGMCGAEAAVTGPESGGATGSSGVTSACAAEAGTGVES